MRLRYVLLLSIVCLLIACNSTQRIDYSAPSKEQQELTKQKIDKFKSARKRILFQAYKKYTELADFKDENDQVTDDVIWEFKYLFESSAKVWNDIQLYDGEPKLIEADAYADLVATYMKRKGVITEFEKPNINDFFAGTEEQYNPKIDQTDDSDDIFYYTFKTVKKNYNILNKNNQVLYYEEPMIYPIEITFRISIKNQRADIVSILPSKDKKT